MPDDYVRMPIEQVYRVDQLAKQIDDLRRQLPNRGRDQTDRDAVEYTRIQDKYGPVYEAISDGLPPIKADESPSNYRVRLLGNLRDVYGFGQKFKNEPLGRTFMASRVGFEAIEDGVIGDGLARANSYGQGEFVKDTDNAETRAAKENSLRMTTSRDESGRVVNTFHGSPKSWMQYYMGASGSCVKRIGWPPAPMN